MKENNNDSFILKLEYKGRTRGVVMEDYPTLESLKKDIDKILPEIWKDIKKHDN